jgi:hypothetical protein
LVSRDRTDPRARLIAFALTRYTPDECTNYIRSHGRIPFNDEHLTVDGALLESWESLKSVRREDSPEGRV